MATGARCCGCYKKGRCTSCVCFRSERQCGNCRPSCEGHCYNPFKSSATDTTCLPACGSSDENPSLLNGLPIGTDSNSLPRQPSQRTTTTPTGIPSSRTPELNSPSRSVSDSNFDVEWSPSSDSRGRSRPQTSCRSTIRESDRELALPPFIPSETPAFVWGDKDALSVEKELSVMYKEAVHWKKNCFVVPFGRQGKLFVSELARLFRAYGEGSALECVVFKAVFVALVVLLQKPHPDSRTNDHIECLKRRIELWQAGNFDELFREGKTIQQRLRKKRGKAKVNNLARSFSNLIFQGKTSAAIKLLMENESSGVLELNARADPSDPNSFSVLKVLKNKHPSLSPCTPDSLFSPNVEPPNVHPVIFDRIDACCIRSAAVRTFGAGGPSQTDAHNWRRMCSSFKSASDELCWSLALVAKRICTTLVDPSSLAPFLSCRLIVLDKMVFVQLVFVKCPEELFQRLYYQSRDRTSWMLLVSTNYVLGRLQV